MHHRYLACFALAAVAASTFAAQEARACGGTFCDTGPTAMPVDQTGENILFVMDEGRVEAHIQIQYDPETEAEQFAWVVPLMAVPEFSVGSDPLFQNLLNGSVPQYGFTRTQEDCGGISGGAGGVGEGGASDSAGDGGGDDGGPDVVLEETVGAFDIVVLSGGTAAEVMDWLNTEGYQQDPKAEPILAEYVQDGFMFAAFKLTNGADTAEIHPVVLEFENSEACVPLRLTRIAAQEDMEVRTFFLSDDRVVPKNYRHVLVNPLKIDWLNRAANYKDVITAAVDADRANGKAFVTEYAGSSTVVPRAGLYSDAWDAAPFATIDPVQVVDTLGAQGILYCEQGFCDFRHPLLEGLLQQWLPVPTGLTPEEFWGCLSCYEDQIDYTAWNGDEFATAYQQRIIDPGLHAVEMLDIWPYLTRMYTTISPGEMTEDPLFHENPDLEDVTNVRMGELRSLCGGDSVFILPDGREVYLPDGAPWPEFQTEMPWEEEVETIEVTGAPTDLVNNTERIDTLLAEYNAENGWPPGCGCRAQGPGSTGWTWASLLVLLVLRRRRDQRQ